MNRRTARLRFSFYLLPFPFFILLAAAAPAPDDDLIRAANAAFLRDDFETADQLYAQAEERTADPGLVAFNRAAVLFERQNYREAELQYARVLEDKACPSERAAQAWYNRGVCLMRRGSPPDVYRSAVACFERCLEQNPPDQVLAANARDNLELAKLLWTQANRKAERPKTPNEPPPEERQPEPPPQVKSPGKEDSSLQDMHDPSAGPGNPLQAQQTGVGKLPKGGVGVERKQGPADPKGAGAEANLPPLQGGPPLSEDDANRHLDKAEARIRGNQASMNRVREKGPRPLLDW